jgi:hypothetical protein
MRGQYFFVLILLILIFCSRCAQVAPLTGGARDTKPPVLVEAIPAQNTSSVSPEQIVLRFNEYVQLKDLSNQLVIAPRLEPEPVVTAEGKKIIVTFEKNALKPNTTYRLQFGDAIADMNESNPVKDFSYTFSTGQAIDTLSINGILSDASTGAPVGQGIAALYPAESPDSILFHEQPLYLSRINTIGSFSFHNLPPHPFRLYAFTDNNRNGIYDGASEKVAFSEKTLQAGNDTVVRLRLFQEEVVRGFVRSATSSAHGIGQIILNKRMPVTVSALNSFDQKKIVFPTGKSHRDTVNFFYREIPDTIKLKIAYTETGKTDTLRIAVPKPGKRRARNFTSNLAGGRVAAGENITLTFNAWMDSSRTDSKRISLTSAEDTLAHLRPISVAWNGVNRFTIKPQLLEGMMYRLKLDTAAFYDVYGHPSDSALFFFKYAHAREAGKLALNMRFERKQEYIVQLFNSQGAVVRELPLTLSLASPGTRDVDFNSLNPGDYAIRVIFDDNGNGRWDTGDVIRAIQPEKVYVHAKQMNVIADWETEEEIHVKE